MTERRKKPRAGSSRKQVAGVPAREAGPGDYAREAMQQWGRAIRFGAAAAKPALAKAVADLPERAERIRTAGGALRERLGATASEPETAGAPEPEDEDPQAQPDSAQDRQDGEEDREEEEGVDAEDEADEDEAGEAELVDHGEDGEPEHAYSEAVEEIEHHEAYAEVLE
jgi:hypothetical protein